jgi:plasmid stabilization system protein ParE
MSRYRLSRLAVTDLEEIRRWYLRERGPTAARQVLHDLRAALRRLAEHPNIGHPREDLAPGDTHFWPHHRFLIIFLPGTSPLQVLRIWDASRGTPPLG